MFAQKFSELVLALAVVIATSTAPQCAPEARAANRILVKVDAQHMSEALTGVPLVRGAVLDADSTGIDAVDAVVQNYGRATISRPFLFYSDPADNVRSGQERWFEFRFERSGDIDQLGLQLQALSAIEAIEFVYKGDSVGKGRDVRRGRD